MMPRATRVLAFDPGTLLAHWALVEGSKNHQTLISCGSIQSDPNSVIEFLRWIDFDLAAVEIVGKFFGGANTVRVSPLIHTSRTSGIIIGCLHTLFSPPMGIFLAPASTSLGWRKMLTGDQRAGDKLVKANLLERGVISPRDKTNEHTRDAIGIGVTALITDWQPKN